MPFSATASLVSTDMDNTLRGLNRNNADISVTGTTVETDLASFSVPGGTIGATGGLHVLAVGNITGVAGTKTMRFYFGGTVFATITDLAANTFDWMFDVWIYNTATGAQRFVLRRTINDGNTVSIAYTTGTIDTTANQIVKVTGQLGAGGDTIKQTMFDIMVVQIQ